MAGDRPLQDSETFWELVSRRADLTPDEVLFVDQDDRRITFGEFRERAERVAAGLHAMGVGPGDEVTWQLPTRNSCSVAPPSVSSSSLAQRK